MNDALTALAEFLKGEEGSLPASVRKKVYKGVKYLASLVTLALLVLPALPSLGVNWSKESIALAVSTTVLAFLGHLADPNTDVPAEPTTPPPADPAPAA